MYATHSMNSFLSNGEVLYATYYPAKHSHRVLVYAYGLTSTFHQYHSGFTNFAETLRNDYGISVITFDYRGTCFNNQRVFSETSLDMRLEDLHAIVSTVRRYFPSNFIVLGGHSAGGALAAKLSERHEVKKMIDGLLLSAPAAYAPDAWGKAFGDDVRGKPFSDFLRENANSWEQSHEFRAFQTFPKPKSVLVCKDDDCVVDSITDRYIGTGVQPHVRLLEEEPFGHKVFGWYKDYPNRLRAFTALHGELYTAMEEEFVTYS